MRLSYRLAQLIRSGDAELIYRAWMKGFPYEIINEEYNLSRYMVRSCIDYITAEKKAAEKWKDEE